MSICGINTQSEKTRHNLKIGAAGLSFAVAAITALGLLANQGVGWPLAFPGAVGAVSLAALVVVLCKGSAAPTQVSHTEETTSIEGSSHVVTTHTFEVEHFNPSDFFHWVKERRSNGNKRALMNHVFKDVSAPPSSVTYKAYSIPELSLDEDFAEKCNAEFTDAWFQYDEEHSYIDFANRYTFGGGWRTRGFVQEEIMFFEFTQLAMLAYLSNKANHPIHPAQGRDPQPFVIEGLRRDFVVNGVYGRRIESMENFEASERALACVGEQTPVTITGIAAKEWTKGPYEYTEAIFLYHLKAAYLAFLAEKDLYPDNPVVQTGKWGCGAFRNSEKMMTAIQLVAARMAGVQIKFHGMEGDFQDVVDLVDGFNTAEEAIAGLLAQQETDASWKPRKPQG